MPQLLVMAMPLSDLDQGSYQNQLDHPGSGTYHPQPGTPQCKSLIKLLSKMVQPLGLAMPFCKMTKPTFKQFGFNYKGSNGFAGFVGF